MAKGGGNKLSVRGGTDQYPDSAVESEREELFSPKQGRKRGERKKVPMNIVGGFAMSSLEDEFLRGAGRMG